MSGRKKEVWVKWWEQKMGRSRLESTEEGMGGKKGLNTQIIHFYSNESKGKDHDVLISMFYQSTKHIIGGMQMFDG